LPYTRIAQKHLARKGDVVLAFGNQFGSDWTVSAGVISGFHKKLVTRHRRILRNLIQTDVAINPSNIGGPLINQYGEIIGINAFLLKGIGFVSNITVASKTIDEIVLGHNNFLSVLGMETMDVFIEQVQRIWFGIANKSGVKIIELNKKGLAAQCGLKPFDIIVGVNSVIIEELADLRNCFVSLKKSLSIINELQFHILRKNQFMQVRVVLSGTENN
jgi:S1-C subfamily serine protease